MQREALLKQVSLAKITDYDRKEFEQDTGRRMERAPNAVGK